eukprot:CAMPEP_0114155980 /NCGR_PEP_ID=MMETSP0043_2-20121206/25785_1 /TAXON_ID=464988 /ORGANISM="Hemiselmis andersenii, Strain CCMP644" /LENGTH=60 /DNA_ID=CAMNT_0001251333 /DNA_START=38 /DNA_END=223 /DNA_ORIENTATION=+
MNGFQTSCQLQGHNGAEATYHGCPSWFRSGLFPKARAVAEGLKEGLPTPPPQATKPSAKK